MCSTMRAPAAAATPAAPAPQPTPAPQPAPQQAPAPAQPTTDGRLAADMGIADMDDATLTALVTRAMRASITHDGRQDTPAQRIADALGFSANRPESVAQEALAQYRGQRYEDGTIYRTVNDTDDGKAARDIAHDLTSGRNHGLNFGGGRAYGTGLYFAGTGGRGTGNAGARESYYYGNRRQNPYMVEAHIKPTARIAKSGFMTTPATQRWAKAHRQALTSLGLAVTPSGQITLGSFSGLSVDVQTTVAMMMGYDGYRNSDTSTPYYTIWNRGCLQVARGNKYARVSSGTL